MKRISTRLSLTSLDDRVVPSTSLADPNQSGVVIAIYIEGTGEGGVTTGPFRPSDDVSSGAVADYAGDAPLNRPGLTFTAVVDVNDRRGRPKNIDPAPTPRFIDANGVPVPKRQASAGEQAQSDKLRELGLDNIDRIAKLDGQCDEALVERSKLVMDPRTTPKQFNENAKLINSLNDQIYMLRRKGVEIRHAL